MNNTDYTSPARGITAWAHCEDLPPRDLFDSIESYRTFVKRWRALYKEVAMNIRNNKIQGRYNQSVSPRPGRKEVAEAMQAKFLAAYPQPSPDFLAVATVSPYYHGNKPFVSGHHATTMLSNRMAGKRWVKAYYPWKRPVAAVAECPKTG